MLLESPPPDATIFQGFNFAQLLDQADQPRSAGEPQRGSLGSTAILDAMSQTAVVRPVVFNRELALERMGGLPDLLVDVMRLIQVESPKVHAQLHLSLAQCDSVELKRAAHMLKGTVSIVGAVDLAERLARVEQLAVMPAFKRVTCELPEIDRQFQDLLSAVAAELQKQF